MRGSEYPPSLTQMVSVVNPSSPPTPIHGTFTWEAAEEVSQSSKDPLNFSSLLRHCPGVLHVMQRDAADPQSVARDSVKLGPRPLPGKVPGHSHLAWTCTILLSCVFCRTLATQKPGRRESMGMVIFST